MQPFKRFTAATILFMALAASSGQQRGRTTRLRWSRGIAGQVGRTTRVRVDRRQVKAESYRFVPGKLTLTDDQKSQASDLQKDVDIRLDKILTTTQKKPFKTARILELGGHNGRGPGGGSWRLLVVRADGVRVVWSGVPALGQVAHLVVRADGVLVVKAKPKANRRSVKSCPISFKLRCGSRSFRGNK